ncbi:MAG: hypothetical protein ABI743_07515 [bacterium]
MATPPKKKFKVKPSKLAQKQADQEVMRKMVQWVMFLLVVPVIILGVKQVNPGIFYIAQGKTLQRFHSDAGASKAFLAAYDANPEKNVFCLVEAAYIAWHNDDFPTARDLTEQILDPGSHAGPADTAAAKIIQAWLAYEDSRYDDAKVLADAAIPQAKAPYKYWGWIVIGAAYTKQAIFDKAYTSLDTAMDQNRMFAPEAHLYMGLMYEAQGKKADADEQYAYGLDQQPDKKTRQLLEAAKARVMTSAGS